MALRSPTGLKLAIQGGGERPLQPVKLMCYSSIGSTYSHAYRDMGMRPILFYARTVSIHAIAARKCGKCMRDFQTCATYSESGPRLQVHACGVYVVRPRMGGRVPVQNCHEPEAFRTCGPCAWALLQYIRPYIGYAHSRLCPERTRMRYTQ